MSPRVLLPALLGVAVGCSLVLQPDEAIQCVGDADCAVPRYAGRVCEQGFCVAPGAARQDAAPDDERPDGEAPDDGSTDGPKPGLLEPGPGDVVMLLPSGIVSADHTRVTAWNNSVQGASLRSAVVPANPDAGAGEPYLVTRHGNACLAFALDQRLVMTDDSAGALTPPPDFSVLAVVSTPSLESGEYSSGGRMPVGRVRVDAADSESMMVTGWALKTAYQPNQNAMNQDRFAASLVAVAGVVSPQNAVESIDPAPHDQAVHVLALQVRRASGEGTPQLQLWVDGVKKGAAVPAAVAQPAVADLALGAVVPRPYPWAASLGELCTVIVHHGAETDAELVTRTEALKTLFGIP